MKTALTDFSCSDQKISKLELILGYFLTDLKQKKKFFDCYKSQVELKQYFLLTSNSIDIPIPKKIKRILSPKKGNDIFSEFLKRYKEVMSTQDLNSESKYRVVQQLKDFKGNLLADLLEVYLFIKANNIARAEKNLSEIMGHDFIYHTFNSTLKREDQSQVHKLFIELLSKIKQSEINKRLFENLIIYFLQMSDGKLRDSLVAEFDVSTQMTSYRRMYQSFFYGYSFPFVWSPQIFENGSREEYDKFIEKINLKEKIKNQYDYLLLYRSLDNIKDDSIQNMITAFKDLTQKDNLYFKNIYFRLREDNQFNRVLISNSNLKTGLLINEKRRYFLEKLKTDLNNTKFYLLQLIMLGDLNKSYFFELVRHDL